MYILHHNADNTQVPRSCENQKVFVSFLVFLNKVFVFFLPSTHPTSQGEWLTFSMFSIEVNRCECVVNWMYLIYTLPESLSGVSGTGHLSNFNLLLMYLYYSVVLMFPNILFQMCARHFRTHLIILNISKNQWWILWYRLVVWWDQQWCDKSGMGLFIHPLPTILSASLYQFAVWYN